MANLNITTVVRPKIPRNKYGYLNSGVIIGGSTYNSGGSGGGSGGGGDSSGGETYSDFVGATSISNGEHGLVPQPRAGQENYVLHGSGSWRQLFGGHLYYDETTGTLIVDSSLSGTQAYFENLKVNDVSVFHQLDSILINSSTGNFKVINASTGNIHDLNSSIGNFKIINGSTGYITDLYSQNINTKNLTVTGLAHFYELMIDKIKASGGAVIFSPADGFKVKTVEKTGRGYKLYWPANDQETDKATVNMWKINDQAIVKNFNEANVGMNYDIANKYYWSLVIDVSTLRDDGLHYIEISDSIYDGEVNPEEGDEVAMLGYRGNDDPDRQSAIYISAYTSLDSSLQAPLWAHYTGINNFQLESHRRTWFAANGSHIRGSLAIETGQNIEDLFGDLEAKTNVDIRVNSDKGSILQLGEQTFTLTAEVWYNNGNITSSIPQELFSWERSSGDTLNDNSWNIGHVGVGSSITISQTEVYRKANFCCLLDLDELKRRHIIS